MAGEAFRRIVRMWATVFVVYALLLASLPPARADVPVPGHALCMPSLSEDPAAPLPLGASGDLCCIVCHAGVAIGGPSADAVALDAPVAAGDPVLTAPPPVSTSRPPPGASPLSPRAPPILL